MATQDPISAAQLEAARTSAWRQAGDPLHTLEAARGWLAPLGLVLFAPRAQQLGAPAPSFVEATLGAANDAPSLAETETARSLMARLVAEGDAVPLNLLGGPGDLPDFLASAQVFSFVYTLRGDKLWKQPPTTTGANKVTPLALSVYGMLAERGPMSAADLASELGRELTESAIARSLGELWQHMRVIPLPRQGEGATQWELTSRRFTKTIKAGTNAGQPTALSALVSLYLAQALLAAEDEVAAFLSPLSPRSRIREVLHALIAARELNEMVIDGKTLLHIPGALPEFAALEASAGEEGIADGAQSGEDATAAEGDGTEKIKRFAPRASSGEVDSSAYRGKSSAGPGYRSKPAGGGFRKASTGGAGEARAPRPSRSEGGSSRPPSDRERRPFQRAEGSAPRPERPSRSEYAKPWDEDRKPRREGAPGVEGGSRPPRTGSRSAGSDRPYRAKPFGDRPGGDRPARKPFGDRPAGRPLGDRANRTDRTDRPARKPFGDRTDRPDRKPFGERPRSFGGGQGSEDRPRRSFSASGDRPARAPRRDSAEGGKPFRPRSGPPAGDRPYRPRAESGSGNRPDRPDRPHRPRPAGDGEDRPRRSFAAGAGRGAGLSRGPGAGRPPREGGFRPVRREGAGEDRPPFRPREGGDSSRPPRVNNRPPFGDRPRSGSGFAPRSGPPTGDRKPYTRRPAGEDGAERPRRSFGDREQSDRPRPSGDRVPFADRKGPSFGAKPRGGKPFGAGRPGGGSKFGGRPAGKSAGSRPFSKGPAKGAARPSRPSRPRKDE